MRRRGRPVGPRWVLGVGAGAWASRPVAGASEGLDRPTVPSPAGRRWPEPALVGIVIDESPSEQGADPYGYRHVAGRRVVEVLRHELAHRGDRVAVVHFTDVVGPVLRPANPHRRRGARALRRHLRPAGRGEGTDIGAALARTARLFPRRWPGPVVVVLLTDGVDDTPTGELSEAVGLFPAGSVHAVSVEDPLPERWADVALGSATVVTPLRRPDEVEWAMAKLVYSALGVGWSGPELPPDRG